MSLALPDITFIFNRSQNGKRIPTDHVLDVTSVDTSATYESLIRFLIRKNFLLPLDPPLQYNLYLRANFIAFPLSSGPAVGYGFMFNEGQPLSSLLEAFSRRLIRGYSITNYECSITIEIMTQDSSKKQPNSATPNWDKIVNTLLTSLAANAINFTSSVVTITTALVVIEKWWSNKHSAVKTISAGHFSESEIEAIRLLMTDGTQHRIEEWLTDPARLKHYINVFNQPSGTVKPLQAIFLMKHGNPIIIDVSQGAQNNNQLDELLSYLKIDPEEKQSHSLTEDTLPLDNNSAHGE